ncbi:MAG: hypothetical protein K9H48_16455 [Melioribacteraceae bacterium]|nr:hypothetical protein [Saprospiraceae bacterium]MCF8356044.1 hypothetical protein [Melioribacteraceae bacterium]MCF8395521.1 hypothetical protein [Melioribacteraceae bacterium]
MEKSISKYFHTALKAKLNDCLEFVIESHCRHEENLSDIEDELSLDFYKELIKMDFSLDYGVISTYSIFDYFFQHFCITIEKLTGKTLVDQKGNNDNDKRRKFIKNVTGYDIGKNIVEWKFIEEFRKIRNLKIHNNSNLYFGNYELKKNPNRRVKELIDIVELNPFLSYDKDYGKVYIDDVLYVDDFVKAVITFFEKLDCKELNSRI